MLKKTFKASIKTTIKYCKLPKVTYNLKIKHSRLLFKVQKYSKSPMPNEIEHDNISK